MTRLVSELDEKEHSAMIKYGLSEDGKESGGNQIQRCIAETAAYSQTISLKGSRSTSYKRRRMTSD